MDIGSVAANAPGLPRGSLLAALETAQRLALQAPETHYARGALAYFCENDWVRAMDEYRVAEAGLPNDAQLITKRGLALRRAGKASHQKPRFPAGNVT